MTDEIRTTKRDLVARVATLELLVSDLAALLWRVQPVLMAQLAQEADHDLTLQNSRILAAAEHQRERLFAVLQDRKRRLQKPRSATRARTPPTVDAEESVASHELS
jgi:hypothetical protein